MKTAISILVLYAIAAIAFLTGWVMNIVTVVQSFDLMSSGEAIVRIIGIAVPFIGAVAGYF